MSYSPRATLLLLGVASLTSVLGFAACVGDTATTSTGVPDGSTPDTSTGADSQSPSDASTTPDSADAAVADAAPLDAGPRCNLAMPFGQPVNEGSIVNTALAEDGARLSPDESELFLTRSQGNGDKVILRYVRAADGITWKPNSNVEVNLTVKPPSPSATASLAIDPTALNAYMAVLTDGGTWQIDYSSRASIGGQWQAPTAVPLTPGGTLEQPWVSPSGKTLYFMSNRSGPFRIYSSNDNGGAYSAPALLDSSLKVTTEDRWPVLSADEQTLFFGAYDGQAVRIFKKTRSTPTSTTWTSAAPETVLNAGGGSVTAPTFLSADGCVLYFTSNRAGGQGDVDVYHATRGK